jgi:hypothetical protein
MMTTPTLFQTPPLPCFASEFRGSGDEVRSVAEKDGVWKIGKVKVKGGMVTLSIGDISFGAARADVVGRACVVSGDSLLELPDWGHVWVVQPSEDLFK